MKLLLYLLVAIGAAHAQWERISVPTTASFRGLSVVSQDVIWASGTGGTVIRTADGGQHWSVITVPGAQKLDFRGIHAFDAAAAIIISSGPAESGQARIYRTTDGGATWKQVFEEDRKGVFFDAIAFWDRKHGIVLSDPVDGKFALFITDDAGATWKQVLSRALPPALSGEGAFAASNSCLTVQGDRNVWFATGGSRVARVFRSVDRGGTWSVAETPMHPANASSGIFSLAFQDAKNGVAAGGDYAHPERSDLPNALATSDGGQTWLPAAATDPAGMYFSSIAVHPASHHAGSRPIMWTAGSRGLYTTLATQGRSWAKVSDQDLNIVVYSVHGAWAAGPKGMLMREER